MIKTLTKHKKLVSCILLVAILLTSLSTLVSATTISSLIDTSKTASLTIVKYENAYGTDKTHDDNVPLADVEFTIYKLDTANYDRTASDILADIESGTIQLESTSLKTGTDGTVTFSDLALGRYLVVETDSPSNVSVPMDPFLIDLPRSNESGTDWDYDITVYPKNETVYGDVVLNKIDFDGNPLEGTTWELQVENDGTWSKYEYNGTLTTDENGQISLENLPAGHYRLVETSTLDGYILDQSNYQEFTVSSTEYSFEFTSVNEKMEVEKTVYGGSKYVEDATANATDTVSWQIKADIPYSSNYKDNVATYYITDTLPKGLDYVDGSLTVQVTAGTPKYAINSSSPTPTSYTTSTTLDSSAYTVEYSNHVLTITFDLSQLARDVYGATLKFDTTFNDDVTYGEAQVNSATITYTNVIDIDGNETSTYTTDEDTAEVHTGAVLILKVDEDENPLAGAKFKIATSEENAENGVFVKDSSGNDIEVTSDDDGYVLFTGLAYGSQGETAEEGETSYWIVETETPTYVDDNGETKHYNLLSSPVEVKVNSESGEYSSSTPEVVNKKGFVLPLTGGMGTLLLVVAGVSLIGIAVKLNKKKENN